MEKTNKMLAFLHPILEEADPELEDFLIRYVLYGTTFTFLASAFFCSLLSLNLDSMC